MNKFLNVLEVLTDYYKFHSNDLRSCFVFRNVYLWKNNKAFYGRCLYPEELDGLSQRASELPVYFYNDVMSLACSSDKDYGKYKTSMSAEDNLGYRYLDSLGFSEVAVNAYVQKALGVEFTNGKRRYAETDLLGRNTSCCVCPVDIVEGVRYKVRIKAGDLYGVVFSQGVVSVFEYDYTMLDDCIKADPLSMISSIQSYLNKSEERKCVDSYFSIGNIFLNYMKAGSIDKTVWLSDISARYSVSDILSINSFSLNGDMVHANILLKSDCCKNVKDWYRENKGEILHKLVIAYNRWSKKGKLPINYYKLTSVYMISPSEMHVVLELKVKG